MPALGDFSRRGWSFKGEEVNILQKQGRLLGTGRGNKQEVLSLYRLTLQIVPNKLCSLASEDIKQKERRRSVMSAKCVAMPDVRVCRPTHPPLTIAAGVFGSRDKSTVCFGIRADAH